MRELFLPYLKEDEEILSTVAPNTEIKFLNDQDLPWGCFGVLMVAFCLVIICPLIFIIFINTTTWITLALLLPFSPIFAILAFVVYYIFFERLNYKSNLRKNTYYAITSQRILRLTKTDDAKVHFDAVLLSDITNLQVKNSNTVIGSILFDLFKKKDSGISAYIMYSTGLHKLMQMQYGKNYKNHMDVPRFAGIYDVLYPNTIYTIILNAKNNLSE